jgi:hypothetical protein
MGFLSGIGKGIKKVFKKIGRGIKKVVKKIGRAVGKLGLVGQIGMMFLMPYAMGGLSSLFGNLAGGTAGTWANSLISSANIGAKALGHTMNAIHTVGTTMIKPFQFVRDQIGEAVNWIGERTGLKSVTEGSNKLLETFDVESIETFNLETGDLLPNTSKIIEPFNPDTGEMLSQASKPTASFKEPFNLETGEVVPKQNLLDPDASWRDPTGNAESQYIKSDAFTPEGYTSKVPSFTNTSEQQGWFSKQGESIVNAFKDFSAGDAVKSGLRSGGSQRLAYAIAGPPPQQRILQTVRSEADILGLSSQLSDSTVYRSVNLASESQGNVWAGSNALNYDYVKSVGNDGTADYFNNMRGLELMSA